MSIVIFGCLYCLVSFFDFVVSVTYNFVNIFIARQRMLKKRCGRHYTLKKGIMYELRSMIRHLITPK